jgi:hypothetical protein
MSQTLLDKFRSALPTTQGNQILRLLISKRDSGEIKTVDEFKTKLKELTLKILQDRITPTFKLLDAIPGTDISSERYNEVLDRIHDDLEAAFDEADNIDDIIEAHHNLINNVALKALRYGVNELEAKITLYEFLNKSGKGFDDALFNTFRESQNSSTSRIDEAASIVFVDPRLNQVIVNDEDCMVDQIGERLILGAQSDTIVPITEAVWLSNPTSIRSELSVEFQSSRLSNIIDGRKNTFWLMPILCSKIRAGGVPMEIALHLSAAQDVNYIEIEPASNFPMLLVGIDYFDANNTRLSVGTSSVTLYGPVRINFERITTRTLILRFRQDNYQEIQFNQRPGETNFQRAVVGQSMDSIDMDAISDDLRQVLTSDFILTDLMGVQAVAVEQAKYYEYLLGFDNIRAGFSTYNERGIFVSSKKVVTKPGQIGLRVNEVRSTQTAGYSGITLESFKYPERSDEEDSKFYHGVNEYFIAMQFFSEDNYLIATDIVPVLPLGAKRIYHERVLFTYTQTGSQNPDTAKLMFYTEEDYDDVVVYRNGTELVSGEDNDWIFVPIDDNSEYTQRVPDSGRPMSCGIKIINQTVQPLDIYTISYTPTMSNTWVLPLSLDGNMKIVDLVGDNSIRSILDNVIVFESLRGSHPVARAEFYLIVIMRRNSAEQNFSPALEDYMLITGSRDTEKFTGD